jgi:hypothetical protein
MKTNLLQGAYRSLKPPWFSHLLFAIHVTELIILGPGQEPGNFKMSLINEAERSRVYYLRALDHPTFFFVLNGCYLSVLDISTRPLVTLGLLFSDPPPVGLWSLWEGTHLSPPCRVGRASGGFASDHVTIHQSIPFHSSLTDFSDQDTEHARATLYSEK